MFKYAFIGAGPAALNAVIRLPLYDRAASVIVDAGARKGRKVCPALKSYSCSSCFNEKCHVINGVGGASATFGNKYCQFPASSGVKDLMGAKAILSTNRSAYRRSSVLNHPNVPNRKVYDVLIAHADEYRAATDDLVLNVEATTPIFEGWSVQGIERLGDKWFRVSSEFGETIDTENVVIATGRSGHIALRKWLDHLNIDYLENSPDIGFRLEAPSSAISSQFLYQDDPKFKFDLGDLGQVRTFCTCKGGRIVPVKFGNGFFADGAFVRKDSGRTNVALMARTGERFEPKVLEAWCKSINKTSDGGLLLGALDLSARGDNAFKDAILDVVPDGPSPKYKTALRALLNRLLNDPSCQIFDDRTNKDGTLKVFGPSIDLYWPRIELSSGFQSSVEGVYVIGDAAGVSRGIVQAAATGQAWAESVSVNSTLTVCQ